MANRLLLGMFLMILTSTFSAIALAVAHKRRGEDRR